MFKAEVPVCWGDGLGEGGGEDGASMDLCVSFPLSSHPSVVLGVSAAAEQAGVHTNPRVRLHQPPMLCAGEGFGPTSCMVLARLILQSKNERPYSEN